MTKEFLYKQIAYIDKVAQTKKDALYKEYVKTNAQYRIGDIATDSVGAIKIADVSYQVIQGNIRIVYFGHVLTKKYVPRSNGETRVMIEENIKYIW